MPRQCARPNVRFISIPNPKLSIRQDLFLDAFTVAAPNTAGVVRTQEAVTRTNRTASYFRRLLQRCGTNRGHCAFGRPLWLRGLPAAGHHGQYRCVPGGWQHKTSGSLIYVL